MKIYNTVIISSEGKTIYEDSYDYNGDLMLCGGGDDGGQDEIDSQIKSSAQEQIGLLQDDLAHITGDESIFGQRSAFNQRKRDTAIKSAVDDSMATVDSTQAKAEAQALSLTDKKQTFASGSGYEARKLLSDSLKTTASIADKSIIAGQESATMDFEQQETEIQNDLYEALRDLQSEITSIRGSAEGATGDDLSYGADIDWSEYGL
tara:strand:+ start:1490 stop:2107 length:618 start_codon:yes stop_codon:yes gene_type:complete